MAKAAETQALWGAETEKAIANFPVSGEPIPTPVARWLGRIKAAAARANADLELLDRELADRIAAAGDRIAAGEFDDQFPIDVFQTGLGHELEHERERGHRDARRRGRPPERPREHGPVVERRLPVRGAPRRAGRARERPASRTGRARRVARAEGRRVRRRREVGTHAPHGRRARDARPGVRQATRRRSGRESHGSRTRCRDSARSRSAAPRPVPA